MREMKATTIGALILAVGLSATPALAQSAGPTVELPPAPAEVPPAPTSTAPGTHGDQPPAEPHDSHASTVIGGYAEMHDTFKIPRQGGTTNTIDLDRLVLMVGHDFTSRVRFYTEIEVEHAVASSDQKDPGEVEIEQAYLDFKLFGDGLVARVGVGLVPMGLINEHHEPPVFNGVARPMVDTVIIPSTWREALIGVHGRPTGWLHYQAYAMSGFNPMSFSADDGIRHGRQEVAEARAKGFAGVARLEVEPVLGLIFGTSGYAGMAGPNADPLYDANGQREHLDVPLTGFDIDARWVWHGLEARGELAAFFLGDTAALRLANDSARVPIGPDVGSKMMGGYLELAYDVFHPFGWNQHLAAFARRESYDTVLDLSGRARTDDDRKLSVTDWVLGLTYKPISQVVLKSDVVLRRPIDSSANETLISFGVGCMY